MLTVLPSRDNVAGLIGIDRALLRTRFTSSTFMVSVFPRSLVLFIFGRDNVEFSCSVCSFVYILSLSIDT